MKRTFDNEVYIPSTARELEARLGVLLLGKAGMERAFQELANNTTPLRFSSAFKNLSIIYERGEECTLRDFTRYLPFFSNRALYILASPFSDQLKGQLLTSWNYVEPAEHNLKRSIVISIATFLFSIIALTVQLKFIMPQLYEIFYGMNLQIFLDKLWFLNPYIIENYPYLMMLLPLALIVGVAVLSVKIERFLGASKHCDRANLYRLLAIVPQSARLEAINFFSALRGIFVAEGNVYGKFSNNALEGMDLKSAAMNAGLDVHFAWLLASQDTLENAQEENSSFSLLQSLANLHLAKLETIKTKVAVVSETAIIVANGLIIGILVWTVFYMLQIILVGIL